MNEKVDPAVGIDLGTTFSVVAFVERDGRPKTIDNEEGESTTPSVVFFDKSGTVVGREAVKAAEFEPERIAQFAKRNMGDVGYRKVILGRKYPPEAIQALVLQKLKRDAARKIGEFSKAVITVPAYFNEPRRKATQDAGRMAGIDVIDIINEPTAAAIAYGVEQGFVNTEGEAPERELVLVYDLGGGTFDATLMEIDGGNFNTVATSGDVYLGGIDWDARLVEHLAEQFEKEHGVDPRHDDASREKLTHEASEAKRSLTAREETTVHFVHETFRSRLTVTREEFEELTADLLDRTRLTISRLLKDAEVTWKDVSRLLLVGGSTRMPMVQRMLEAESGLKVDRSLSPDEAVAHGAAVYAGILLRRGEAYENGVSVRNVNSHHLGVMGIDMKTGDSRRHVMIARNTRLPAAKASKFTTSKDGQRSVAVSVVEGGTDSGEGSTEIGKCVVTDLPPELPRGTPVLVIFQYKSDGRLSVRAEVPDVQSQAHMVIDRTSGLTESEVEQWQAKVEEGIAIPVSESVIDQIESVAMDDFDEFGDLDDDLELGEDVALLDEEVEPVAAAPPEPEGLPSPKPPMAKPLPKTTPPAPVPPDVPPPAPAAAEDDGFPQIGSPPEKQSTESSDDSALDDFLGGLG
jgi:molecular chaperone DnaK